MAKVCVVGLGVVGLATAVYISKYHRVWGCDIDSSKVDKANQQIMATPRWEEIPQDIEVYIICVGTGLNKHDLPDVQPVFQVCRKIRERARCAPFVSIESTVSPGSCRKVYEEIFGGGVYLAHVPHRFWPADPVNYGVKQIRVMGAIDETSRNRALHFYKSVNIPLWRVSTIETAELAKVAENSLRFVEISFAEQLCMIAEKNGIDLKELRQACNTLVRESREEHYRLQILEAREGIGGTCLPKDIRYLISMASYSPLLEGAILTDWRYTHRERSRRRKKNGS